MSFLGINMEKKVTIYDIARVVGVSAMTVTRAFKKGSKISEEKRREILSIAEKMKYIPNNAASRLTAKAIRIGIIISNTVPEFTERLILGINNAYKQLKDYKLNINIKVIERNEGVSGYISAINDFENAYCQGVIIMHGEYYLETIKKIEEIIQKGIFVTVVGNVYREHELFNVSFNTVIAAKMACELLSNYLTERKNVVIFSASEEIPIHKSLVSSFLQEADRRNVNILNIYYTENLPQIAKEKANCMLKNIHDVDGIYIDSANSVPIIEEIINNGLAHKIKIIASDIFPKMEEYIKSDVVSATIFQNQYLQSFTALINLFNYISANKTIEKSILITPELIIKSNLEAYSDICF